LAHYANMTHHVCEREESIQRVSNAFWSGRPASYPNYGSTKKRRLHEINYVLQQLQSLDGSLGSLVDIGCGTGSTVTCLQELTDISSYYCYDISSGMLSTLDTRSLRGATIHSNIVDLANLPAGFSFPKADVTICFGVFQYLSDEVVSKLLRNINSRSLLIRDACYMPHEGRQVINTYSEQLSAQYACRYRTVTEYLQLCCDTDSGWHLKDLRRAFPDSIESNFGSKQWFVHLSKV